MTQNHVTIKIPKELVDEIDKIIGTHGFRSRGEFAKEAIRKLLDHYKSSLSLPRFEILNHDENGVKVIDRQLGRVVDVYIKPVGIKCLECNSSDCVHVNYVLEQPDIQKLIRKKRAEGWKLPDV